MQAEFWQRVDQTEWESLEHFVLLNKKTIPTIFRDLVSSNEKTREQANREFAEVFIHQYTLVEALYYALPLLIELAEFETLIPRDHLLDLITHYAWLTYLAFSGDHLEARLHTILKSNAEIFVNWLLSAEGNQRLELIKLVGFLTSNVSQITPHLLDLWQKSLHLEEQLQILKSLSYQINNGYEIPDDLKNQYLGLMYECLASENSHWQIKYRAALGLIEAYKEQTPSEVIEILFEIVFNQEQGLPANEDIWRSERIDLFVALQLGYLNRERASEFLLKLARDLDDNTEYIGILLFIMFDTKSHFNDPVLSDGKQLNLLQKEILEILLQKEEWSWHLQYDLGTRKLPRSREELQRLLDSANE